MEELIQSQTPVCICVDALGGDNAPGVVLEGVDRALAVDPALSIILTGPKEVVEPFAATRPRVSAVATTQFIDMDEHPAQAVRTKGDSSIVAGCRLVKEGRAQGFFSAGSTGACMAAATLVMGRIKGIARPAIATVIPSPVRPVVLTDVGANADCKPEYLLQFAQMGSLYAQHILGIAKPRVALLNIGEEETKGSVMAQESYALMKEKLTNFAGNAEGRDILAATYDVFVTDGFTGNVVLKTIEGTSSVLFKTIKGIMVSSLATKLAALVLKPGLKKLMTQIDPDTTGGAPLLGVRGACIIAHGSSNAEAIANGIAAASKTVRVDLVGMIAAMAAND
ncbi:MAG: phosphate acyltransferase PlsX [Actinobacteria bacterium]|nr:phosphate acyltransferase PlsX [Actinomycetota bacterium]